MLQFAPSVCTAAGRTAGTVWLATLLLVVLGACTTQRAPASHSLPAVPVVHATARQIARAMNNDDFFARYDGTVLVVRGTIRSLHPSGRTVVLVLNTGLSTKVLCDVGRQTAATHAGEVVSVESANPQQDASRVSDGVMLRNCRIRG